jgi:NhaP-type Na+/H+ or K+/H+ antiporter
MSEFGTEAFIAALAIIGIVIVVSALLSGLIERSGLPQVAVFLGIGAALGPAGLGLVDIGLESHTLRVVATLSLTLVLFTDAVALNISEVKKHWALAVRLLGPGTLLSSRLVAASFTSTCGGDSRRCSRFNRPGASARTSSSSRHRLKYTSGFATGKWTK